MAVNDSRSMTADLHQGVVDSSYMQLTPNRANPENPPIERLTWPRYQNVERWCDSAFWEAKVRDSMRPIERKASYGTDSRF
jgi:hypothetical protein